jgi:hypothetical protein
MRTGVSDRSDYFEAFGGLDSSDDPDASLKFVLNALMMSEQLEDLATILTDGHDTGGLEGDPGWMLQRRDSGPGGDMPGYQKWPQGATFRAFVDPDEFHLEHPEAFANNSVFHKYVRDIVAAYVARNPAKQEAVRAILSLARD